MKLILKIAAGVLLGLLIFTGVPYLYHEYERTKNLDEDTERAFASLHSETAAQVDQLKLENDKLEASLNHGKPTKSMTQPTTLQLDQKKCERLKTSYFSTHNASAISRQAAEHCHSVVGTDHVFFSNALDGTLSVYDLPTAEPKQ
jgi:hypothetical protein